MQIVMYVPQIACNEWFDVRAFGQVFAFKDSTFGKRTSINSSGGKLYRQLILLVCRLPRAQRVSLGKKVKHRIRWETKHRVGFAVYKVMEV